MAAAAVPSGAVTGGRLPAAAASLSAAASYSTSSSRTGAVGWLARFVNYEQRGVPAAAGTDSDAGFDLVRGAAGGSASLLMHASMDTACTAGA